MIVIFAMALAAARAPVLPYFDRAVCAPLAPRASELDDATAEAELIELEPRARECLVRKQPSPREVTLELRDGHAISPEPACVAELLTQRFAGTHATARDTLELTEQAELDRDGIRGDTQLWCACGADLAPGTVHVSFRAQDAAGPEKVKPYFVSVVENGRHLACLEKQLGEVRVAPSGDRQFSLTVLDSDASQIPRELGPSLQFEQLVLEGRRSLANLYRIESRRVAARTEFASEVERYNRLAVGERGKRDALELAARLPDVQRQCTTVVELDRREGELDGSLLQLSTSAAELAKRQAAINPAWVATKKRVDDQIRAVTARRAALEQASLEDAQNCDELRALQARPIVIRKVTRTLRSAWDVPHPPADAARTQIERELRDEFERQSK